MVPFGEVIETEGPSGQKQELEEKLHHWVLGRSYRIDRERSRPGGNSAEAGFKNATGWNAATGITRTFGRQPSVPTTVGRIDIVEDETWKLSDRYHLWLEGVTDNSGDNIFRMVLNGQDDWQIRILDNGLVHLTAPCGPVTLDRGTIERKGTRELFLDPNKGFFPIKGSVQSTYGQNGWQRSDFAVEEAQSVKGVWMPLRMRDVVTGVTLDKLAKCL